MITEIINNWVDNLMKDNNVDKLEDLSVKVINNEIKEAKGTIENCKMQDDKFGIICNQSYIEFLKDALSSKSQNSITISNSNRDIQFNITTLNDNGSGMSYHTKEELLKEISMMIDDCIQNGGKFFNVLVNSDVSCFNTDEGIK